GTVPTSPFSWKAGRFCRTAFRERVMGSFAGVDVAPGFDGNGSGNVLPGGAFGFSTGGSGVNGKEVGTGGPLEAGTLSDADAPVPFGETSIKGIFLGAGGSLFGLSAGEESEMTGLSDARDVFAACTMTTGSAAVIC